MKNENSLIPDNHHFDSDCELLQNEIIRLEEVGDCIFCSNCIQLQNSGLLKTV